MSLKRIESRPGLQPDQRTGLACIVDTETTGLTGRDEAIELALVLFAFDRQSGAVLGVVDQYVGLREPTVPISARAFSVHGISADQVRGKRLEHDRVEAILIRAEVIIAHNVSFDRRFVVPLSDTAAEKPWRCSMAGVDWYGKGFRSRALQHLLEQHRITVPQAHRALDDVYGVLHLLAVNGYLAELLQSN